MSHWAEISIHMDSSIKNKISAKKLITGYFTAKGYNEDDLNLSLDRTKLEGVRNVTHVSLAIRDPDEELFKDLFGLQKLLDERDVHSLFNIAAAF